MTTDEKINKKQWDRLNNDQKNSFQEEIGKTYKDEEFPSYGDIFTFLGNNKLTEGSIGDLGTPSAPENIEKLWERVFSFLNG